MESLAQPIQALMQWCEYEDKAEKVAESLKKLADRRKKLLEEIGSGETRVYFAEARMLRANNEQFEKIRQMLAELLEKIEEYKHQLKVELKYIKIQQKGVQQMRTSLESLGTLLEAEGISSGATLIKFFSELYGEIDEMLIRLERAEHFEWDRAEKMSALLTSANTASNFKRNNFLRIFQNLLRDQERYSRGDAIEMYGDVRLLASKRTKIKEHLELFANQWKKDKDVLIQKLQESSITEREAKAQAEALKRAMERTGSSSTSYVRKTEDEFNYRNAAIGAFSATIAGGAAYAPAGWLFGGNLGRKR